MTKVVAIIAANVFAIAFANARADDVQRVKLFVRETPITVNGGTINMCSVVQADGTTLQCGVVLATQGANIAAPPTSAAC